MVPENPSVLLGNRGHGERQATRVRPEKHVHAVVPQKSQDILLRQGCAAPVVIEEESNGSLLPSQVQPAGAVDVGLPDPDAIQCLLSLARKTARQREG